MTVETVTYINDLNPTYPTGSDPKNEGDNHIRNFKTGVKNTFPNITGAVTATQDELNQLDGATIKTLTKDHGTKSANFSLDMSEADVHLVAFSANATLTISSSLTNDKAIVIVKSGGNTITLSGINNNSPTITATASKQDFLGLVKSFGKISCVAFVDGEATA